MPARQNDAYSIDTAAADTVSKSKLRETVVIQLLGLAALALVTYSVMYHNYRVLKYTVFMIPAVTVILKPNLIPYAFMLNFFVPVTVFSSMMLRVMAIDAIFLLFIVAFIVNKKNLLNAALEKQRPLFTILCVFMLWASVGYIFNFPGHKLLTNVTSAFFIFNIAQLIAAVIIFSQPDWKAHREKIIIFYIASTLVEIGAALAIEVADGARTLKDLHKLTGTLGNHHGMLANILVLGAGVSSAAFFQFRDNLKKHFSIIVCLSCLVMLFISGSRGILLGMFLAVPVIVFLNYSHKPNLRFILLLALFAAGAVLWMSRGMILDMVVFQNMDNPDMSAYTRVLIWERVHEHALHGSLMQKIVGIGIGTFNTLPFSYFLERGTSATGAHNNYLHAFVETGIVGLAIFSAIFIEIIRRLVIRSRRNDNAARCFLMCTLTFLLSGLTQETFWFQPAYGRVWLQYLFCYLILFNFNDAHSKDGEDTLNLRTEESRVLT